MKRVIIFISLITSIFIINNKVYAYQSYKIGDKVTYNDIDFYVIKDSSSEEDSVTLLKAEPLTVEEVNLYGGVGTDNNHVNKYTIDYQGQVMNKNGYGGMAYYSSESCRGYSVNNCINNYSESDIKFVVDAWASNKIELNDLIEASLISFDDLISNFGYKYQIDTEYPIKTYEYVYTDNTPKWLYNNNYDYWTKSVSTGSIYGNNNYIWSIGTDGNLYGSRIMNGGYDNGYLVVRPTVELYKSSLPVDDGNQDRETIDDDSKEQSVIDNKVESKQSVTVPNTLKSVSGLIILVGLVLVCAGLNIFIIIKNKDRKKD